MRRISDDKFSNRDLGAVELLSHAQDPQWETSHGQSYQRHTLLPVDHSTQFNVRIIADGHTIFESFGRGYRGHVGGSICLFLNRKLTDKYPFRRKETLLPSKKQFVPFRNIKTIQGDIMILRSFSKL